jgi:hypothetical protein
LYLYEALRGMKQVSPDTIDLLKQRFSSPAVGDYQPVSERRWEYSDDDEKIHLAATLAILDDGPERADRVSYILDWLKPNGPTGWNGGNLELWSRQGEAIQFLTEIPDGKQALPLLKGLLKDLGSVHPYRSRAEEVMRKLR